MVRIVMLGVLVVACSKTETSEVTVTVGSGPITAAKPVPLHETLESSLRKKLEPLGFKTFACPDVASETKTVSCTVSAPNGVSIILNATSTARKADMSWKAWGWEPLLEQRVITAEELADKIRDGITAEVKKAHPKATSELACGTSPVLFVKNKASCKLTIKKPDKVVDIAVDDSKGDFQWSADKF